ncbi:MAG: tRNA (N6-threonylcarbamoyladenosine(37)-N6)-methyltransferase TrmO [Lentisphaeria bacterium]|nr:tRNA (N6-threonylcarbamoyladenosine(37)-N6)-methyltransferase TrmO [Lentisphaeria bacterium]
MSYEYEPVGIIRSCFSDKFGTPRQSGLTPAATGTLELLPPYDQPETVRGLEGFSHLWLVFVFHQCAEKGWHPTVRPPRLGGNQRLGVFATRSPFRPNSLGLSAVRLLGVDTNGGVRLRLGGLDLIDGTPVLDAKPYVAYADSLPQAKCGFATDPPAPLLKVSFSEEADEAVEALDSSHPNLRQLVEEVIRLDPRPAYRQGDETDRVYGMVLHGLEIRWSVAGDTAFVTSIGGKDDPCIKRQGVK